jgi:hypothetical protein
MLLLNLRGNRFCGNVGREHRSNGVYCIVDLAGGTWHQRCYDPECRGYRSECMPLPLDTWARHRGAAAAAAALAGVSLHPSTPPQQQQQQQQPAAFGADENDEALLRVMDEFEASMSMQVAGARAGPSSTSCGLQQHQQHCSSGALRPTQPRAAASCTLQAGGGHGGCGWMEVDGGTGGTGGGGGSGAADDAALLE